MLFFSIACPVGQFRCPNGQCVMPWHVCNLIDDCLDYRDEVNCSFGSYSVHSTPPHFTPLQFHSSPLPPYSTPLQLHFNSTLKNAIHSTSTLLHFHTTTRHSTPLHATPLHATPRHSTSPHSTLYTQLRSTCIPYNSTSSPRQYNVFQSNPLC